MSGCLILINKHPGTHPVGVGETWWCLFAKCVLRFTWPESTNACQDEKLYDGLNTGIDGAIHGVQAIWDVNFSMEDWLFPLVDTKDMFKKINQIRILWTVCHLWPPLACLVLNCYRHWSSLVLRNGNGMFSFLHIREGVTQGDPLDMAADVIGVIPLIKWLKEAYPDVNQPWYVDDDGEIGMFNKIGLYFNLLKQFGLGRGYYPKPPKRIPIVHPDNIAVRKEFGLRHRFKVCTGTRYLGYFIGDDEFKHDWLKYWTLKWDNFFVQSPKQ